MNLIKNLKKVLSSAKIDRPDTKPGKTEEEFAFMDQEIQKAIDNKQYERVAMTLEEKKSFVNWHHSETHENELSEWVGTKTNPKEIINKSSLSGHISWIVNKIKDDQIFRRALLAYSDSLLTFKNSLDLPDSDMRHTCMLALMYERSSQLDMPDNHFVEIFGCNEVLKYTHIKIGESVEWDVPSNFFSDWSKEFIKEYGPAK